MSKNVDLVEKAIKVGEYIRRELGDYKAANEFIMDYIAVAAGRKEYSGGELSVTKRDGNKEPMLVEKALEKAKDACDGIDNVNPYELILDSKISWTNGMPTTAVHATMKKAAEDKIDVVAPNWTFVAARLELMELYHNVGKLYMNKKGQKYPSFRQYVEMAESTGKFHDFWKDYDIDEIDKHIAPERDNQFTYLGIKMLEDRYLLRSSDNKIVELPQHMFMAVAMFLAHKEHDKMKWALKFYEMLSKFYVMAATPTLSNARTKRHQLSSCFVGSNDDSLEGIFDGYKEKAFLSKFGGGVGWDWSQVRATGSSIDRYKDVARGVVPFIKIDNDTALAVDQLGTRKGAFADYIQDWHLDISKFLQTRDAGGEERNKAFDIFPAIWVSDEFMRREANDEMWTLFDPYDVPHLNELYGDEFTEAYIKAEKDPSIRKSRVRAREIFSQMMIYAARHGVPFVGFKDTANRENKNKHTGVIRSSNLCTEIFQTTEPDRNMVDIYLDDKEDPQIQLSEFEYIETDSGKKMSKYVELGDVVDGKKVTRIESYRKEGRTAICNLASINLPKVTRLTDDEFYDVVYTAIRMLDNVIDCNLYPLKKVERTAKLTRAIGLGVMGEAEDIATRHIMFGSKEHEDYINEVYSKFRDASVKASQLLAEEKGAYPEYNGSEWEKPMRNAYINAIAPTSSIALITGTTSTIEPVYKRKWNEENAGGSIPVTAPKIDVENYKYYVTAYGVDQEDSVRMNGLRSKYIDQGISFNLFIDPTKVTHVSQLANLYRSAWMNGLKSVYYVRSQAPDETTIDRSFECSGCQ